MKLYKKILLGLFVVLVVIQFIRPSVNKTGNILSTDLGRIYNVPQNAEAILQNSCNDCHSNNTRYPWYGQVQPLGWLLANHIRKGKAVLNLSDFGTYSRRRQISKLRGMANSIKDGSMPISSYTLIHKTAKPSNEDKKLIIDWLEKTRDSLNKIE